MQSFTRVNNFHVHRTHHCLAVVQSRSILNRRSISRLLDHLQDLCDLTAKDSNLFTQGEGSESNNARRNGSRQSPSMAGRRTQ